MANLGLILKESVMNASTDMTGDEFKGLVTGMFKYAVYGEQPNFETALQKVIFEMEKPSIDYNNQKWELKKSAMKSEEKYHKEDSSKKISALLEKNRDAYQQAAYQHTNKVRTTKITGKYVGVNESGNEDTPF